jgi:transposase-like protein
MPSYGLSGEIEADERYFGGVRKGKRGRGAAGKVAVFGLLKRGGKVYTAIIAASTTRSSSPIRETTSTASNRSTFIGFSRSANGASMEATAKSSSNSLNTRETLIKSASRREFF